MLDASYAFPQHHIQVAYSTCLPSYSSECFTREQPIPNSRTSLFMLANILYE
jgi:hypothetical protein